MTMNSSRKVSARDCNSSWQPEVVIWPPKSEMLISKTVKPWQTVLKFQWQICDSRSWRQWLQQWWASENGRTKQLTKQLCFALPVLGCCHATIEVAKMENCKFSVTVWILTVKFIDIKIFTVFLLPHYHFQFQTQLPWVGSSCLPWSKILY